jgi:hypothetical protein
MYQTLGILILCSIPYMYNRLEKSKTEKRKDAKKKSDKFVKDINAQKQRAESVNF